MQGLLGPRQGTRLPEPGLDGHGAGDTRGCCALRLEVGEDGGRQRLLPRWRPWLLVGEERRQATGPILAAPAGDGSAVDGEGGPPLGGASSPTRIGGGRAHARAAAIEERAHCASACVTHPHLL